MEDDPGQPRVPEQGQCHRRGSHRPHGSGISGYVCPEAETTGRKGATRSIARPRRYTPVVEGLDFEAIAGRHGARLLLHFGSTVTGREHTLSDVDVAVLFDGEPTFARLGALLAELEPAFPGRSVDLGVLNRADPLFLKKVMESARLLAGTPRALAELRLRAFRRYQDHRRYLALERRHLDRFLAARTRP